MEATNRFPSVGDRPGIIHKVIGRAIRQGGLRSQRGFTLIEMLAVMAILGVLAAIVATSVGGLGSKSTDTRLAGDVLTLGTAADRFFTEAFPQTYPVVLPANGNLTSPAGDVGVREIDFDAKLPQTPSTTLVPDLLKEVPDSAGQVSWRIDTNSGLVFPTEYGAPLILPAASRLNVAATTSSTGGAASTVINAVSSYTLNMTMKKNEAAVKNLKVVIPAGYSIGDGANVTANRHLGTLTASLGTDNNIESGQSIVFGGALLTTTDPNAWKLVVDYGNNLSTTAVADVAGIKPTGTSAVRVHTVSVSRPTADNPGLLTLTMDRDITGTKGTTADTDYNQATETWKLEIFGTHTRTLAAADFISSGVVASGVHPNIVTLTATAPSTFKIVIVPSTDSTDVTMITNPATASVYRWLGQEESTIDVKGVFSRVAGNQAVIITAS